MRLTSNYLMLHIKPTNKWNTTDKVWRRNLQRCNRSFSSIIYNFPIQVIPCFLPLTSKLRIMSLQMSLLLSSLKRWLQMIDKVILRILSLNFWILRILRRLKNSILPKKTWAAIGKIFLIFLHIVCISNKKII